MHRRPNYVRKISKLVAMDHFESPVKILCGLEVKKIGGVDVDRATSKMRTR